jgi:hypothetical protein
VTFLMATLLGLPVLGSVRLEPFVPVPQGTNRIQCSEGKTHVPRSVTKVVNEARIMHDDARLASRFGNMFSRLAISLVRVSLTVT